MSPELHRTSQKAAQAIVQNMYVHRRPLTAVDLFPVLVPWRACFLVNEPLKRASMINGTEWQGEDEGAKAGYAKTGR